MCILYFVRESRPQISKNTIEKCCLKEGFPGTIVESDKNNEHIAPSDEVPWKDITTQVDSNNYATCDDKLSTCATKVNEVVNLSEIMNSSKSG